MKRYITLGADEFGRVYGMEIDEDGTLKRDRFGSYSSCDIIQPIKKKNYEYMTEDPESVRELWMDTVAGGLRIEAHCGVSRSKEESELLEQLRN